MFDEMDKQISDFFSSADYIINKYGKKKPKQVDKYYTELRRKVNRANKAIARIERDYGENSWGVNRLYNKLDNEVYKGITKGGRIRLNKSMSDIQLKAIEKATNNFLEHKATSTLRGIKNTKKEVKNTLKATLGDIGNNISDREIDKLYDLVEDKDKRDNTQKMGASTIWTTLVEAKDVDKSGINNADDYINLVEKRTKVTLNEEDKDFLEEIYLKYFNKM